MAEPRSVKTVKNLFMPDGQMVDEPTPEQQRILDEIKTEEEAAKKSEPPMEEKDKPKPPAESSEEKPKNVPADGEDEDDEEDDEEEEEDLENEDDKPPARQPKFVRLEKHLKERQKVKELTDTVADLQRKLDASKKDGGKPSEALQDELKKFAEESGMDPVAIAKIVEAAEKGAYAKLKNELGDQFKKLEEMGGSIQKAEEVAQQETIWRKQFSVLLGQFPEEKEHLESIKGQLKKLAFSQEYHMTPLEVIYRGVTGLRPDKRKTLESGRGGSSRGDDETGEFQRVAEEGDQTAILEMDSEKFGRFQEYIKKHNK